MNYIKINYLNFETIPKYYTFFIELKDDNSFNHGLSIGKNKINKHDDPRDPDNPNSVNMWLRNTKHAFNEEEIKKYRIPRDEFMKAHDRVARNQRIILAEKR